MYLLFISSWVTPTTWSDIVNRFIRYDSQRTAAVSMTKWLSANNNKSESPNDDRLLTRWRHVISNFACCRSWCIQAISDSFVARKTFWSSLNNMCILTQPGSLTQQMMLKCYSKRPRLVEAKTLHLLTPTPLSACVCLALFAFPAFYYIQLSVRVSPSLSFPPFSITTCLPLSFLLLFVLT